MKVSKLSFAGEQFYCAIPDNPIEVLECVKFLEAHEGLLGLDLETAKHKDYYPVPDDYPKKAPQPGLDPWLSEIRLVQIFDGNTAFVFDLFEVKEAWKLLGKLLRTGHFVAHNAVFEIKHIIHMGIEPNVQCSMLASIITDCAKRSPFEPEEMDDDEDTPPTGHGLDKCVQRLFNIQIGKGMQLSDWNQKQLTKEQYHYAGLDAVLCLKVYQELIKEVDELGMRNYYDMLVNMQYVVADLELCGLGIDRKEHLKLIGEWENDRRKYQKETTKLFTCCDTGSLGGRRSINLNSPKQLGEWLREHYPEEAGTWPTTKTGALSFSRNQVYQKQESVPELKAYFNFKKTDKLISTYGKGLYEATHPITRRVHGSYRLGSTRTGRLSSANPNLQNLPRSKAVRDIFVAGAGTRLVVADFSQIEMRVAGELSGDPVIRDAFEKGIDLHKLIVSHIEHRSYESIEKDERAKGKIYNFGLLFGMGAKKLVHYAANADIHLSESEAYEGYNGFHSLYRTYSLWCDRARSYAERVGYAMTPLGRKRKLAEGEYYTKAINTPVQGGAAEVMQCSCILLRQNLIDSGLASECVTVLNVHDEIGIECRAEYAEDAKDILEKSMIQGFKVIFPKGCIKNLVEAKIGNSWGEAK